MWQEQNQNITIALIMKCKKSWWRRWWRWWWRRRWRWWWRESSREESIGNPLGRECRDDRSSTVSPEEFIIIASIAIGNITIYDNNDDDHDDDGDDDNDSWGSVRFYVSLPPQAIMGAMSGNGAAFQLVADLFTSRNTSQMNNHQRWRWWSYPLPFPLATIFDIVLEIQHKGVSADPGKTDLRCDGANRHFINSQV